MRLEPHIAPCASLRARHFELPVLRNRPLTPSPRFRTLLPTGATAAVGEEIIAGGFGNRHRVAEVAVPETQMDWAECPDYDCEPCKHPPGCPPTNFTGIDHIICAYKNELCNTLRLEHRACRKARGRMCRPVGKRTRTVCTREVSREWGKKCDEDKQKLDTGLADLKDQLATLNNLKRGLEGKNNDCGCAAPAPAAEAITADSFMCGANGEVLLKSEAEEEKPGWFGSSKSRKEKRDKRRRERAKKNPLSDVQSSLNALKDTATDLLGDDVDGLKPADLAVNLDGFSTAMDELEDSIAALEELIRKLEAKRRAQARMCDPNQDVGMSKHVLNHCVEVEEPDRMFDRHEEKCAKRTADALAQSAKLQALIEEAKRRMALLNGLSEANAGVTAAYTDINLTAPAFSILGNKFVDAEFANHTRELMESMYVNETSLCAEVLPTLQFSIQGLGISKDEVWCPTPTGTFIGGRDLPDWAPHFLVGVGLVIGMLISAFAKTTPAIYAFMCDHPLLFLVAAVVLIAGRFT